MAHFLFEKAARFTAGPESQPIGWRYCRLLGAWVPEAPGQSASFPRPRPPGSKKSDMETGEDMKGE